MITTFPKHAVINITSAMLSSFANSSTKTGQMFYLTDVNQLWYWNSSIMVELSLSTDPSGIITPAQSTFAIGGGSASFGSGNGLLPYVSNLKTVQINPAQITATGDVDLYTVPAGRRALISGLFYYNHSGSTASFQPKVKVSGVYNIWSLAPAGTINNSNAVAFAAGTQTSLTLNPPFILEAGETLAGNCSFQPYNVIASIMEFDAANSALKTVRVSSPVAAPAFNVLYTCPAGKTAYLMSNGLLIPTTVVCGPFGYVNLSGGSRTIHVYLVHAGDSPTAANQVSAGQTVTANSIGTQIPTISVGMGPGDSIQFSTDAATATQMAWLTVVEI